MNDRSWLTPAQAAHYLGVSIVWLAKRRGMNPILGGPPYVKKSSRLVGYWKEDLDDWLSRSRKA